MTVDHRGSPVPLGLGMIVAQAQAHEGGLLNEHFQFVPSWLTTIDRVGALAREPGIFLFSNYIWSHGAEPVRSRRWSSRRARTASPSTAARTRPSTRTTSRRYFARQPARRRRRARRGRGHLRRAARAALVGIGRRRTADLSALRDVPGLSFRHGERDRAHRPSRSHRGSRHRSLRRSSPACSTASSRPASRWRDHRDQPGLPVRLHLLRLGIGHPRPGSASSTSTASSPSSSGAPSTRSRASSSPTPTSASSTATSRSPRRSPT